MSPRFLARRIWGAIVVMALASFLVAAMVDLVPGDAASVVAGDTATPEQVQEMREHLGLDRPLVVRYLDWVGDALQGDFGTSIHSNREVSEILTDAIPATLSITLAAAMVGILLGVGLGGVAGLKRGWVDRFASVGSSLGIAMPSFWIGMLLVSLFALQFKILPATGYRPFTEDPVLWAKHLILPALALGVGISAEIARQTRSGVIEVMDQPYIRTARAKGVPGGRLVRRHVARNAAIPVVTVLGLQLGRLLGGVIIIERVFGISGLGTSAVVAVSNRDFPVIQAYVVLMTFVVVLINLVVDVSYGYFNPKVRNQA